MCHQLTGEFYQEYEKPRGPTYRAMLITWLGSLPFSTTVTMEASDLSNAIEPVADRFREVTMSLFGRASDICGGEAEESTTEERGY